jgi:hypothetical protein
MLKCDGNAIRKFKFWVRALYYFTILEEVNVPQAKLFRLMLFCIGDFQIFARTKGKEHAQTCQLDDGLVKLGDLLFCKC